MSFPLQLEIRFIKGRVTGMLQLSSTALQVGCGLRWSGWGSVIPNNVTLPIYRINYFTATLSNCSRCTFF